MTKLLLTVLTLTLSSTLYAYGYFPMRATTFSLPSLTIAGNTNFNSESVFNYNNLTLEAGSKLFVKAYSRVTVKSLTLAGNVYLSSNAYFCAGSIDHQGGAILSQDKKPITPSHQLQTKLHCYQGT